ncbi:hypothetical protein GGQ54_002664 [Naumannella cuiyingiana]|uniref:Purine nucleoside phosphorylase n=1 Tax=Naumannella cuiyingiana TaxID=1347891 RepID=A0A7Z0DAP8_9ACTN|nr:polyphenol oxidase family protein [Naumannella cuiyingiana]NYI72104.1 hypothetical protein [Naumannella cuiyingiana]
MFRLHRPAGPGGPGYAFTDRVGGSGPVGLTLGGAATHGVETVRRDGRAVLAAIGVERLYTPWQVHGTDVLTIDDAALSGWSADAWLGSAVPGQPASPQADALVTDRPGVALLIRTADCLPVIFVDETARAVGVAHAGRVGLAAGVLTRTVEALAALGATAPTAVIGPAICGSCYEVPGEMRDAVAAGLPGAAATTSWGTPALDLPGAARQQLLGLGCRVEQVAACTREDPLLHSYRRDGARMGSLGALVWLAPRVGGAIPATAAPGR